jgi:hypothetical protein
MVDGEKARFTQREQVVIIGNWTAKNLGQRRVIGAHLEGTSILNESFPKKVE